MTTSIPPLVYRTIDPVADGKLVARQHREACLATFGDLARYEGASRYLAQLRSKVEEFPDGHVLAHLDGECVGQLELEVPYGLTRGYVSLYYVAKPFRGRGYGRTMHAYVERYFRSWEADRIELDVSPTNTQALAFYRAMGYRLARDDARLWRMVKALHPQPQGSPANNER